jgi:hypothetical protein
MQVVRGATWEDEFVYTLADGTTPVDLTGYEARMQVRTVDGKFGLSAAETLVLELTTANGLLVWDTAAAGRLTIVVPAADTEALNPENLAKVKLVYSVELYRPGVDPAPEYVIPLVTGSITVLGEITR